MVKHGSEEGPAPAPLRRERNRPGRDRARHVRAGLAVAGIITLAGCGDDPVEPPAPEVVLGMTAVGEQFLTATVGDTLEGAFRVQVVDVLSGTPAPGRNVVFTITDGEGAIRYRTDGGRVIASGEGATIEATTNADGVAAVDYLLSTRAGLGGVRALHHEIPDTLFFGAVGEAGPVAVVLRSGDGQAGIAGTALPLPVRAVVQDAFGNPVPDVPVTWLVRSSEGQVDPPETETDPFGLASVTWTLGPQPGVQELEASVADAGTFLFTATAR